MIGLEIATTDSLATVVLGTLGGLPEKLLNRRTETICQVSSRHHPVLLDAFLHLGSNDVTHRTRGIEVNTEGF